MSDPSKIDISDYFAAAVAATLAGIGGAMTWFNSTKRNLNDRMTSQAERLEEHVRENEERHHAHTLAINTVTLNQEHMHERLDEIKVQIRESAMNGAELVNEQMKAILNEVRKMKG